MCIVKQDVCIMENIFCLFFGLIILYASYLIRRVSAENVLVVKKFMFWWDGGGIWRQIWGGGSTFFTGGPLMLLFMQAVRLLPCSLIYTQRGNEV